MADVEQRLREILLKIARDQNYENNEIQIKPVDSGGANYTSLLFAVTISSSGKPALRLFAKVATIGEEIRSKFSISMFEIETIYYTKILTKYRELEKRYDIPEAQRLIFAKYYGGTIDHMKEVLVLEELTYQGYRPFDRLKCYDWDYASQCIAMLARLHAISVAYEKHDPDDYKKTIDSVTYEFPVEIMEEFLRKSIGPAVKATEEKYKDRVERFLRGHLQDKTFIKYFRPERTVFLYHGDFRPSNILHKTDENGKLKLVLVDHQNVQRGNPLPDLIYFLTSGSDDEFRAKYLHQYFDHYYEEFRRALERFGIDVDDVYKKQHFEEDMKELLPHGLTVAAITLPVITVDSSKAAKPADGINMDSMNMEASELFTIRFNGLVRDYVRMGML